MHCFSQCLSASTIVGARALVVHALNAGIISSYTDLGFEPLAGDERVLFLPLETIADALTP
jgi:hypothetical protein